MFDQANEKLKNITTSLLSQIPHLPMKPKIVVHVLMITHKFHLQYNLNPQKATTKINEYIFAKDFLTVSKLIKSWFGCTGGTDACKLVNVRKTILSWTNFRKLIKSYSRRSCNATWREIISFKWTPLKKKESSIDNIKKLIFLIYIIGILKPSDSDKLFLYWA
jgi:hypothetical protein